MDRNDLVRDVYAHFGLAIYKAQVLEHGLANAMTYASKVAGRLPTLDEYDAFLESKFEKTLGALINDLKGHVCVDPGLQGTLSTALKKRNWLAHHYFRERPQTFMSDRGCATMIAELESARSLCRCMQEGRHQARRDRSRSVRAFAGDRRASTRRSRALERGGRRRCGRPRSFHVRRV